MSNDITGDVIMENIEDEAELLKQILTLISSHFGDKCEVVLHDLTKEYDHTIIDIRNGQVTNRQVGGCGSNLGLEVLNGNVIDGDRYNYVTTMSNGKILRSSSIYIKNKQGKIIASVCINLDITDSLQFEGFLRQYNHFDTEQSEFFAQNVNSLLDYLIQQAQNMVGKDPKDLSKEERISFLRYLNQKGAFQITKSGDRVCEILGISKFTLYNYLDSIRGKK